jgi:HAD superfamily phosphoserine phosphatase-like hydrolase
MYKLFLFDMDGVLLQHRSSWAYCQEAIGFNFENFRDEFERDMLAGMDLTELVMKKMWQHGFTQQRLVELARHAPQTKGIEKVLGTIRAHGGSAVIISGGIGAFAQELSVQYPFTSYVCNELNFDRIDRPPTCDIKVGHEDKGIIARKVIAEMGVDKEETVAVGDYNNDCLMFAEVGMSIAFNGDEKAKASASHCVDSQDLSDIIPHIFRS